MGPSNVAGARNHGHAIRYHFLPHDRGMATRQRESQNFVDVASMGET